MAEEFWKSSPFGVDSIFYPSWEEKQKKRKDSDSDVLEISKLLDPSMSNEKTGLSKYRILLFGGVDVYNDGSYGSNKTLGTYLEKIALSEKYKIPLQKGDIKIVNSPLLGNEIDGKDIYKDILNLVKKNFDTKNGILILYGYSWGGQLLMEFLKFFKESNININLLLTVDSAKGYVSFSVNNDVTSNVKYNLNFYQTKKSLIGSKGGPNEGANVKNVNLTGEKTSKGEDVTHGNIDEYTLLYCAQVIAYALKEIYSFNDKSESLIKKDIKIYEAQGF